MDRGLDELQRRLAADPEDEAAREALVQAHLQRNELGEAYLLLVDRTPHPLYTEVLQGIADRERALFANLPGGESAWWSGVFARRRYTRTWQWERVQNLAAVREPYQPIRAIRLDRLRKPDLDWLLTKLPVLELVSHLYAEGAALTDHNLSAITALGQLIHFELRDCPGISDRSCAVLAAKTRLQSLDFWNTAIGDEGLRQLSHLRSLKKLALQRTRVTARGLAHLTRLTRLEELNLGGITMSVEDLERLKPLQKLKHLYLGRTGITEETARGFFPKAISIHC